MNSKIYVGMDAIRQVTLYVVILGELQLQVNTKDNSILYYIKLSGQLRAGAWHRQIPRQGSRKGILGSGTGAESGYTGGS